jgi:hypothetical protein
MKFFRDCERPHDPLWEVASATQMQVADAESVTELAAETVALAQATVEGVVVATRHPTGWFVHAVRSGELPESHVAPLQEVVTVRTYLLLAHGPGAAWRPAPVADEWRSVSLSLERELAELDDARLG